MLGRVYCIRSHQTTEIYVGSTTQMLSSRMSGHRACYKRWTISNKHYVTSFEILKYEDAYIELIEQGEFASKQEMEKREGHYIREMVCVNKCIAGRTQKEWETDNVDKITERQKQYKIQHAEQIAKYQKEYRIQHVENQKEYKIQHADQIAEYQKEKHNCPCGGKYITSNKAHHFKSKKHNRF